MHDYATIGSDGAYPSGELLKIMDFGVAKVRDEGGGGATETATSVGGAIGTLGYMAPETLAGGTVDARADLFAVGVMIAETLTGVRPFGGRTPQEMIATPLHATDHLPGESAELRALDEVLQRCLAKEPRHRYASAADLAMDLCPALSACAGAASMPATPKPPSTAVEDVTR